MRALRAAGVPSPARPALAAVPLRRWAEIWQRSLRPMAIGRRFLVIPEGCRVPARHGRLPIRVRFGQAFGTGEHASTRLCLRLLEERLRPGDGVADLGAGTAILAMAAARLGAGRVLAADNDPVALQVARRNLDDNRLRGRVRLIEEDAGAACRSGPFDLVLVNIGAAVIERILPDIALALAPGGAAILAGFLIEDEAPLRARAAACGLIVRGHHRRRPWSALLVERPRATPPSRPPT